MQPRNRPGLRPDAPTDLPFGLWAAPAEANEDPCAGKGLCTSGKGLCTSGKGLCTSGRGCPEIQGPGCCRLLMPPAEAQTVG